MAYTVGSLFAGIGGIDLGFERAGFTMKWQVEIDPFCRKVLAKHFPHAERFEDVRNCGVANLSPVDVIVGGFPCQDISNMGAMAGLTGERSGLFFEAVRIIRSLRPRFALLENVANLTGRGMDAVLASLASIGCDAVWHCLPAGDIGAPHERDRVWIVAYPSEKSGVYEPYFREIPARLRDDANYWTRNPWPQTKARICRVEDGIPNRVDRHNSLGNSVVPQIPEIFARRINAALEVAA